MTAYVIGRRRIKSGRVVVYEHRVVFTGTASYIVWIYGSTGVVSYQPIRRGSIGRVKLIYNVLVGSVVPVVSVFHFRDPRFGLTCNQTQTKAKVYLKVVITLTKSVRLVVKPRTAASFGSSES